MTYELRYKLVKEIKDFKTVVSSTKSFEKHYPERKYL